MTLWLILTIMTSAAAVWLAVPLIRRFDRPRADAAADVEVYRDQLREVERERQDGLIDEAQAETAQTEIKRRILGTERPQPADMPGLSGKERSFALVAATGIVVLGSTILYAVTGSPDLASVGPRRSTPVLAGASGTGDAPRGPAAMPPQHPTLDGFAATERESGGNGEAQAGLPPVEEMIRRLAARLESNPGDTEGWRTLGWSYLNIGRFDDAAAAYAKAIQLDPNNLEFRAGRIEALVGAANGTVTPDARAAVAEVLKRDPKDARARYFAGLASEEDGDKAAALGTWTELLKDAGSGGRIDESLLSDLKGRVRDLKRDMGLPGDAVADGAKPATAGEASTPATPQSEAPPPLIAGKGPSPEDVQAAEAMAPADRSSMIRGMVSRLASRLERSPRDADGWIMLIRAHVVLGEGDLAKQALAHSLAAFADDATERDRIAAAARQLGVSQ